MKTGKMKSAKTATKTKGVQLWQHSTQKPFTQ